MKHKTSQILFDYWNKVRDGRPAPQRFEIEPARIGPILPETFILERVDAQTFRFRLAGTRLGEQFGQEFRGCNFLDLWNDSDRITLERQFCAMCNEAAVLILTFTASNHAGASAIFEAVVFPLMHAQTRVTRALGAISVAQAPIWLGHERVAGLQLTAHELHWPDGRRPSHPRETLTPLPASLDAAEGRVVRQDRRAFRVYEGGLGKPKA